MTKNIKKNIKKVAKKPELLLNCVDCKTPTDVFNAYVDAKVAAGKPITKDELKMVEARNPQTEVVVFCECVPAPVKKLPWYKRFWNWICRK